MAMTAQPELAADPRFATYQARVAHQDDLYPLISAWALTMTADELVAQLSERDIPASLLMTIADIAADAHYQKRGTFGEVTDDERGALLMPAPFSLLCDTPGSIRTLGPALGQHNASVYGELLGIGAEQLRSLAQRDIV